MVNMLGSKEIRLMFIHTVYFWLKPGTPEEARTQLVRDCREYLGKAPSVRHLWPVSPP